MIVDNTKILEQVVSGILSHAESHYCDHDIENFCDYIRLFFVQASGDELSSRSISHLYAMVHHHWKLMNQKKPGKNVITIKQMSVAEWFSSSNHTVVQIVAKDMPFLVDSIRMAIAKLGLVNHLMVYMGGMTILRGEDYSIKAVLPFNVSEETLQQYRYDVLCREAPVYVEINNVDDAGTIKLIEQTLTETMRDVDCAVTDWSAMKAKMQDIISEIADYSAFLENDTVKESVAYLKWLLEDHFTFLGVREYRVTGEDDSLALELVKRSGLGVLKDEARSKKIRLFAELPSDVQKLMLTNKHLLVITKTNTRSTVHRTGYTDYIGIKKFNEDGVLIGEVRFIGLYTSTAYLASPYTVPILRKKVSRVFQKSGFPYRSHAGKDLAHILTSLPRDDLFQASVKELLEMSLGVLHMQDRRIVRLFIRKDVYQRFLSALVYLPRDVFSMNLIHEMGDILQSEFEGTEVDLSTQLTSSRLVQIHYVIRVSSRQTINFDHSKLQQKLIMAAQTWTDKFKILLSERFSEARARSLESRYSNSFPAGYMEHFTPIDAIKDMENIEALSKSERDLHLSTYRPDDSDMSIIRFKLYRFHETVPLSDVLPMLENFGLRVIAENPYQLVFDKKSSVWINDFMLEHKDKLPIDLNEVRDVFQSAFFHVWSGKADNDALNTLTILSRQNWNQVFMLRAYVKYLKQVGVAYSQSYIIDSMLRYPKISSLMVKYFESRFSPGIAKRQREKMMSALENDFQSALDSVEKLDDDRILRRVFHTIKATVRTNYFFESVAKGHAALSLKFSSKDVPLMVKPYPAVEIFVYSTTIEGIHLRFDKVARGGLRWSSRPEDFRTEVLDLSKAQQVKNALIVPAGAKGGFVPKNIPANSPRDHAMKLGVQAYKLFINALLDSVDNLDGDVVSGQPSIVAYDGEDPYLVVAADKGTATFSDIANQIASERGFWLDDAFASGGSTGYDHKKIGITAKGAWVSAARHFQEQGLRIEDTEFTLVGIGDMGGDVFGNGLLLSKKIKLVAAFNHRHIFIDPNPKDLESHFDERQRLFDLPGSSWSDYNTHLLSPGGGVFLRTDKRISLSPEARAALGVEQSEFVPSDLIKAVLSAPVDMIWNGGIGTFVKASSETHADVGDRHNDEIRINAGELRAKVFCEGGNLGLTQEARIEYALSGGQINTDFIDNSAGVDCSDHEVNLKILLNSVVRQGGMSMKKRNQLLKRLTNEVSESVLLNNYIQNRLIAQTAYTSVRDMNSFIGYISQKEDEGLLDRGLSSLPSNDELRSRKASGKGLTRPEVSTLIALSKNIINDKLKASGVTENSYYEKYIQMAFPASLARRYLPVMKSHRLKQEIICNQLSNQLVTYMGYGFLYSMHNELDVEIEHIVNAYSVVIEVFNLPGLINQIREMDYVVDVRTQSYIKDRIVMLMRRAIRWLIHFTDNFSDIDSVIAIFKQYINGFYRRLPKLLQGKDHEQYLRSYNRLQQAGVNPVFANKVALMPYLYHALIVIDASRKTSMDIAHVSRFYFELIQQLDLIWFREAMDSYTVTNHWTALAKSSCKSDLDMFQSHLTIGSLQSVKKIKNASLLAKEWVIENKEFHSNWNKILDQLRTSETVDFAVVTVAMKTLSDLAAEY